MSHEPVGGRPADELSGYVRPFPRVLRIEPAAACNLTCSHCPTGTVKMVRGIMRPDTLALALDNLRTHLDAVKVVVLYHGGEPLLHKGFADMTGEIKALGVPFVKTVSNGMLLSDRLIAGLVESGLDAIEFSLDGESPEQNDFIRRDADAATIIRNVRRLIRYKRATGSSRPQIFVSTTQLFRRESGRPVGELPPPPDWLVREFPPDAGEIAGFKCAWAMRWPHMELLGDVYEVWQDPADTTVRDYCDNVENTVTVRWNGDVVACCYDLTSRYVLGNVHQDDLATIWNGRRSLALRRSIATRRFVPLCAACNVVNPGVYLTLKPDVLAKLEPEPRRPEP
jgi:radical SAM protein with 4Fe4S-binding SPASM domain